MTIIQRLAVTILCAHFATAFAQINEHERCDAPKSPLYQKVDSNDALEVVMMTVQSTLNKKPEDAGGPARDLKAVLGVKQAGQEMNYLPVLLSHRGKSRGSNCEAKPFRIKFLDQDIEGKLEQWLADNGIKADSPNYIVDYYKAFERETLTEEQKKGSSQKGNIFAKLGDDVKVVSHCGSATWNAISGSTEAAQDSRLLSEYYIYELLSTTRFAVERTRLARINYLNIDGKSYYGKPKLAFFREPPTSLAKRCGLASKVPKRQPDQPEIPRNAISYAQLRLINSFLTNTDYSEYGHNVNVLFNKATNERYFGPYDFDLLSIYSEYTGHSPIAARAQQFKNSLSQANRSNTLPAVKHILANQERMQAILDNSILQPEDKKVIAEWFAAFTGVLQEYAGEQR